MTQCMDYKHLNQHMSSSVSSHSGELCGFHGDECPGPAGGECGARCGIPAAGTPGAAHRASAGDPAPQETMCWLVT